MEDDKLCDRSMKYPLPSQGLASEPYTKSPIFEAVQPTSFLNRSQHENLALLFKAKGDYARAQPVLEGERAPKIAV